MSNFYSQTPRSFDEINSSSLLLWVFHVDKKAPHAGISYGEKYYSSKVNGKDVDFPLDALISIVNSKKIPVLVFELQTNILKKNLDDLFSEGYSKIQKGDSCLTPILHALGKTDQNYILEDLINGLESEQNIVSVFGSNLPEDFKCIPKYDFEYVQKRLEELRVNGK